MKKLVIAGLCLAAIGSVVLVTLQLTVWSNDSGPAAGKPPSSDTDTPPGPEEECYIAVMNYLGAFPEALSQGYNGVDLRPLQTKFGVQSKTVQVARHYSIEITQKIILEGDPNAQLTAISPKVAADCGLD